MIDPSEVSAVLVTKGDHPLDEILDSIEAAGITDVVVWDNSRKPIDFSCYGRYAGIDDALHEWIFHQDDDLVAPVGEILRLVSRASDRRRIVANNRADEEWLLTGIGSVFHRDLANCFQPYIERFGFDNDFCRVSDVVFAYMNEYRRVVLPYRDLPWARDDDRMHLQPDHYVVRERARERVAEIRREIEGR